MIIYKTTNLINGKIYIGYDTNDDPNYYGSGTKYLNAEEKYGKENFRKVKIDQDEDFKALCLKEIFWISFYDARKAEIGYNIAEGGLGNRGWKLSEEIKLKISNSLRGHYPSEKTRQKLTAAKIGKHRSDESKQKQSATLSDGRRKGENNPMYGRKQSETTKHKQSIANKGTTQSEEHRNKNSAARKERFKNKENHPMYGTRRSEETKRRISESQHLRHRLKTIQQ